MYRRKYGELEAARLKLQSEEAELEELKEELRSFETLVDSRLGDLLDLLSQLNAETIALDEEIRHIREERLFGAELMRYLDGAPRPEHRGKLADLPPLELTGREAIHKKDDRTVSQPGEQTPDIKAVYRRLALRYHPDLARNDADRIMSTEQMTRINQAYHAGDLKTLMILAGMTIPYGMDLAGGEFLPGERGEKPLSEQEKVEQRLKAVHQQVIQLSRLPIIKLSLEVKLARHRGRDLLGELAYELEGKVARKMAERDYLKAQIQISGGNI